MTRQISDKLSPGKVFALLAVAVLFSALSTLAVQSVEAPPEATHDGLVLDPDSDLALLYLKPGADFSVYDQFMMLDSYVAFKKNWERHTKVAGRRIPKKDIERIKREAGALLNETFREELDDVGGYHFVTESEDNVMIIRPAIIDLDISAPDVMSAGRSEAYVARAAVATLYIELYDSVSGEILARAVDRRGTRDYGVARLATRVTNRADTKRLFREWAVLLRKGMDETRKEAGLEPIRG